MFVFCNSATRASACGFEGMPARSGQKPAMVLAGTRAAFLSLAIGLAAPGLAGASSLDDIRGRGALRWASDAEGGAPYIFPDPLAPEGSRITLPERVFRFPPLARGLIYGPWLSLRPLRALR